MGMSSTGGAGQRGVASAINVTPLIDVLLVLLIIFLVVMPLMMKLETLQVPRRIDESIETTDISPPTIRVKTDLSIVFIDGTSGEEVAIQATDIARTLRPKIEAMATNATSKVVFVDFEEDVPWTEVVSTIDTVRALATDASHDEIAVALKVPPQVAGP
jgi:biopolymer transport protein TolR